MPTLERIESWRGQDVLDDAGQKAGRLEEVYYDASGSDPVVISIKHGLLGRQVQLVPIADAVLSRDYLRLPFSGEQIGQSPSLSIEDELNSEQVAAVAALAVFHRFHDHAGGVEGVRLEGRAVRAPGRAHPRQPVVGRRGRARAPARRLPLHPPVAAHRRARAVGRPTRLSAPAVASLESRHGPGMRASLTRRDV